jgi:transcriptional regulator with GAF, ATPase, and Fis domain
LAEEGGFRIDLLFRLKVLFLVLPPLRERDGDVLLLAGHFVAECSSRYGMGRKRFTPGVGSVLESYGWPGNVRELENFVHREFLLADGDLISVTDPSMQHMGGRQERATAENYRAAKAEAISRFDRGFLLRLMARTNGNVSAAAAQAGKERRALGKLLKKYGIDPRGFRDA